MWLNLTLINTTHQIWSHHTPHELMTIKGWWCVVRDNVCPKKETVLFGNENSEREIRWEIDVSSNKREREEEGRRARHRLVLVVRRKGIWCGHDASEIRGKTQLLYPTLPDIYDSVGSVPPPPPPPPSSFYFYLIKSPSQSLKTPVLYSHAYSFLNFLGSLSSLSRLSISQGATISQGAILWYFSIQLFTNHRFRVGITFGIVCSPPQNLCVWVGNVLPELVVLLCCCWVWFSLLKNWVRNILALTMEEKSWQRYWVFFFFFLSEVDKDLTCEIYFKWLHLFHVYIVWCICKHILWGFPCMFKGSLGLRFRWSFVEKFNFVFV